MTNVTLTSKDGPQFGAYFVEASEKGAPGIVLIQEIFGVNASMRAAAERWASFGYNVICPDLFWREEAGIQLDPTKPEEFDRGVELMQKFDETKVVSDLEAARQWLAEKIGSENIAAIGYCWGGRLVVSMAADARLKCAVSYYGVGLEELVPDTPNSAAPTLLHIAALDRFVPAEARATILDVAESRNGWEAYVYDGCDHAFARPNGAHRDEEAATQAEQRTLEFIKKHMS